jgi:hypothetical protein
MGFAFKISCIVCAVVWGVVIFGAIGLAVFNRIRNRDKHEGQ